MNVVIYAVAVRCNYFLQRPGLPSQFQSFAAYDCYQIILFACVGEQLVWVLCEPAERPRIEPVTSRSLSWYNYVSKSRVLYNDARLAKTPRQRRMVFTVHHVTPHRSIRYKCKH